MRRALAGPPRSRTIHGPSPSSFRSGRGLCRPLPGGHAGARLFANRSRASSSLQAPPVIVARFLDYTVLRTNFLIRATRMEFASPDETAAAGSGQVIRSAGEFDVHACCEFTSFLGTPVCRALPALSDVVLDRRLDAVCSSRLRSSAGRCPRGRLPAADREPGAGERRHRRPAGGGDRPARLLLAFLELSGYAFWNANVLTTVLFCAMHVPGWLFSGRFPSPAGIAAALLPLAVLSLVFG